MGITGCSTADPIVERNHTDQYVTIKGKFRSFLLASFQNHLSDVGDRARRLKRGGDKEFVQLDAEEAEELPKRKAHLGSGGRFKD
jgi:hypothetical protein